MEKLAAGNKRFTESEKKNYLLNYGVEIEQFGSEIRIYGMNQNIDNAKGKIKREIFFDNNKDRVNNNLKPLKGGIAENLEDINVDINNHPEIRRKETNNKRYYEKISLSF